MNKSFDYKSKIIYPACMIFFIIVFVYFIIAASAGVNVFESETVRTQVYDNETDINELESNVKSPSALPVQTLFGMLLFSISIAALGLLSKLNLNKVYLNLLHFGGTVLAFFIFVLAMSGYLTEGSLPMAMIACLAISILYFAVRGLVWLIKKPFEKFKASKKLEFAKRFAGAVFAGFTLIVFILSFFALITQFNVIITVQEDKTFIQDDVLQNIFVTVVTPLAPTVQNYLRYLASSAIFMAAYFVLFTKLHTVAKVLINFAILAAGFVLVWLNGFDYFRLVSANALPAIIIFLSVYLVTLITVSVYRFKKRRSAEATGAYDRQF